MKPQIELFTLLSSNRIFRVCPSKAVVKFCNLRSEMSMQAIHSLMLFCRADNMGYFESFGACPFRVRKYVKLWDVKHFYKICCIIEKVLRFPPHAYNCIYPDKSVGQNVSNVGNLWANSSLLYFRRISFNTSLLPGCKGMWKWGINLWERATNSMISSVNRFGSIEDMRKRFISSICSRVCSNSKNSRCYLVRNLRYWPRLI